MTFWCAQNSRHVRASSFDRVRLDTNALCMFVDSETVSTIRTREIFAREFLITAFRYTAMTLHHPVSNSVSESCQWCFQYLYNCGSKRAGKLAVCITAGFLAQTHALVPRWRTHKRPSRWLAAVPWPHDTVTAQTHARAAHWLLLRPCTQPHWRLMGGQATKTQWNHWWNTVTSLNSN